MATQTDFEHRRRERRRRERLRKKRIRAAIILIVFIFVVIFALIFITKCNNKNNNTENTANEAVTLTTEPSIVPTVTAEPKKLDIPAATEENNLMNIIENSSAKKYCYLTFDDGPTENITPQILDTLRRYNVKATFFEIGSLIKTNPDMARRVYDEGHLIANHSDGHNYAKLYVSTDTFMNEVNSCYEQIKEVTGEAEPFKLVRFPGGSFKSSADSYSPVKQECKKAMAEYGFYQCDWNALNGDAEGKTKNAQELLEYCINSAEGQNNVVVLMHDAAAKQATADALASIIEYFMSEGYTFHRLDDIVYSPAAASPSATSSSSTGSGSGSATSSKSTASPSSSASPSGSPSSSPSASASATAPTQTTAPKSTGPIIIN
ncbi:MAG: polysaccharide deacetylase [Clostridia bacterium]|nr:polysaccharide deacetylase [Clostridia bacterium]